MSRRDIVESDIYYFGCLSRERLGHFLYSPGRDWPLYSDRLPDDFPCRPDALDGGLLPPNGRQLEGAARIWKTGNWTIVTFWDRSADSRGNCNSSFVCRGDRSLEEVLSAACQSFPGIMARLSFPVRDANGVVA